MTKILSIIAALFGAILYLFGRNSGKQSEQKSEVVAATKQIKEVTDVREDSRRLSDASVDNELQRFTRD